MATNSNETLEKLDNKIAQLQAQKKKIEKQQRAKEKKERDNLLIAYGELVEKYLDIKNITQLEKFLQPHKLGLPRVISNEGKEKESSNKS